MAVVNFIQVRCRLAKREVGTNVMHVIGEFVGAKGQRSKVTERIRSQRGSYTRFGGVRHGSR